MNLFADSAAWLALYAANDKYHAPAREMLRSLTNRKVAFYVTDYVFDETLTLIRYRIGHTVAQQCGEWLLSSKQVRWVRLTPELWEEAWALFKRYDDQEFSFTDCTSFVVMREMRLRDVFTFDQHFAQMGFRLWPSV